MLTRILTGLVGIPVAIYLIRTGGNTFAIAMLFLSLVGWTEFRAMVAKQGYRCYFLTSLTAVAAINIVAGLGYAAFIPMIMTLAFLGIMLEGLFFHANGKFAPEVALSSLSVFYLGLLFSHFTLLREITTQTVSFAGVNNMPLGEAFLWMVLFGTWASDTFAYFVGSACGKRKLCPAVSPKKSVEGALAGFLGCILVVMGIGVCGLGLSVFKVLVLAIIIAIFAPLGDLVESIWKRYFNIKDSGKIFPGHGGVLDRFDSLLFAVPLAYYFIYYCFF